MHLRNYSHFSKTTSSFFSHKNTLSTPLQQPSQISSCNIKNQKIPLGIQTIEDILKNNYVYIDKTHFAKQLIEGGRYYFINRPRRFGKSLFVSMLKSILAGDKELFKNQSIYQTAYNWDKRSVIHLDFSLMSTRTKEGFENDLDQTITEIAKSHYIVLEKCSVEKKFSLLIKELFNKHQKKVAVLIDDYDKPLTDNLGEPELLNYNRRLMRSFLGVLNGSDAYLDFVFVTGVTKFSHASLFSGANNLNDITTHSSYGAIMGYTEAEVSQFLSPLIKESIQYETKEKGPITDQQLFSKMDVLRRWYNGYRFSKENIKVYNPHSILNYLERREFQNYWMQSGAPSFLIKQIEKLPDLGVFLGGAKVQEDDLSGHFDIEIINIPALMWQAGYFTIQGYDPVSRFYTLDFPNQEIRTSFSETLLSHVTNLPRAKINSLGIECKKKLEEIDLQTFCDKINTQCTAIAYQIYKRAMDERFFHVSFTLLLAGMSIPYRIEESTNLERIDLVIELDKLIYVIEIKKDKTAGAALDQIRDKEYITKFNTGPKGKDIIAMGINFDSKARSINDWKAIVFSSEGEEKRQLSYTPK
ncbi:AAA family ATPase [Rhabdochlamydiaceae symbiont of Dictyostelium giganteum]|uniref:ATP-binding protein n=1 Tax=Rhabdochlamydiaceae symbiont of Dictyostelium giganteum TaxID=3342349 RepID=UPI00384CE0E9